MAGINKKYSTLIFGFLMSLLMSLCISFVLTWVNAGLDNLFVGRWLKGSVFGFIVGFPVSLLVIPSVKKIVDRMTCC